MAIWQLLRRIITYNAKIEHIFIFPVILAQARVSGSQVWTRRVSGSQV